MAFVIASSHAKRRMALMASSRPALASANANATKGGDLMRRTAVRRFFYASRAQRKNFAALPKAWHHYVVT
jgi:hypothetical protein